MTLVYRPILRQWGGTVMDPTGLLLRLLPSIVHHSDFLFQVIRSVPAHPFSSIPLLQNPDLLLQLKDLITLEPTDNMKTATGIPPHINLAVMMKKLLSCCTETLKEVKNMVVNVQDAVNEAYENKAAENGHMTAEHMNAIVVSLETNIIDLIDQRMSALEKKIDEAGLQGRQADTGGGRDSEDDGFPFADSQEDYAEPTAHYRLYAYSGKWWHVPENFELNTTINLRSAFRLWLFGMPGHQVESRSGAARAAPVQPFRLFKKSMLPKQSKLPLKITGCQS